jgi:hypothetical protein
LDFGEERRGEGTTAESLERWIEGEMSIIIDFTVEAWRGERAVLVVNSGEQDLRMKAWRGEGAFLVVVDSAK